MKNGPNYLHTPNMQVFTKKTLFVIWKVQSCPLSTKRGQVIDVDSLILYIYEISFKVLFCWLRKKLAADTLPTTKLHMYPQLIFYYITGIWWHLTNEWHSPQLLLWGLERGVSRNYQNQLDCSTRYNKSCQFWLNMRRFTFTARGDNSVVGTEKN